MPQPHPDAPAREALHVALLCAFAFAQPVYDLLGRNAEFFVAWRAQAAHVLLLVLLLSVVIPALAITLLLGVRFVSRTAYRACFLAVLAGLTATACLPLAKRLGGLDAPLVVLLALAVGMFAAASYHRFQRIRQFLTFLSPAILIFPTVFALLTPVSKIVLPRIPPLSAGIGSTANAPVVMIVFDMLPVTALMNSRREIDVVRYPNFGRLSQHSSWFRQATTVSGSTMYAIPALLTGRYPVRSRLPIYEDYPQSLFTLFGLSRELNVFEFTSAMCPPAVCASESNQLTFWQRFRGLVEDGYLVYLHIVLPQDWTRKLPPVNGQWSGFQNDAPRERKSRSDFRKQGRLATHRQRIERVDLLLDRLIEAPDSPFSYVHINLPHPPYHFLGSGKTYMPRDRALRQPNLGAALGEVRARRAWADDEYLIRLAYQRMILQVVYADRLLGRLIDGMQAAGFYDRALVVVVADHGQSYNAGKPQRSLRDADTLHVPLFVKLPGQRHGSVDDRPAEIVDVVPTIADALNIEVPWQLEGRSLVLDSKSSRRTKRVFMPRGVGTTEIDWPIDSFVDRLLQKQTRVGSGDMSALFRIGPHSELIGRQVVNDEALVVVEAHPTPDRIVLHPAELLDSVELDSGFLPAYLTGVVQPGKGTAPPLQLAIAINGVVVATCPTYQGKDGATKFAAMVPERVFRSGSNSWQVYVIEEASAGRFRLRRMRS